MVVIGGTLLFYLFFWVTRCWVAFLGAEVWGLCPNRARWGHPGPENQDSNFSSVSVGSQVVSIFNLYLFICVYIYIYLYVFMCVYKYKKPLEISWMSCRQYASTVECIYTSTYHRTATCWVATCWNQHSCQCRQLWADRCWSCLFDFYCGWFYSQKLNLLPMCCIIVSM